MSATAYRLKVEEAVVVPLTLEGSGQSVVWLACLAHEQQEGREHYIGTVWSVTLGRPVRVGKRGEKRRVMESREEALQWFELVTS